MIYHLKGIFWGVLLITPTEMEEVTYESEKSPKRKKKNIENFLIRGTFWVSP